MDLFLLTIAKRGSLGNALSKIHASTILRLKNAESLFQKIENSPDFTEPEKEHNRAFTIVSVVSFFENYLNIVLFNVIVAFPEKFGKRQFEMQELKEVGTLSALFEKKANQAILEWAYGRFDRYIERFSKVLDIDSLIDETKVQIVNEIKVTRDVFVHNDGKSNIIYLQKAGDRARVHSENEKLPLDSLYVSNAIEIFIDFLNDLFDRIPSQYKNLSHRRVFKTMWEHTCLNDRVKFENAWEIIDEENFIIRDLETDYGFSHSEVEIYKMFKDIYQGRNSANFGYLFRRWGPSTKEHQIALSWLNYPFWL